MKIKISKDKILSLKIKRMDPFYVSFIKEEKFNILSECHNYGNLSINLLEYIIVDIFSNDIDPRKYLLKRRNGENYNDDKILTLRSLVIFEKNPEILVKIDADSERKISDKEFADIAIEIIGKK